MSVVVVLTTEVAVQDLAVFFAVGLDLESDALAIAHVGAFSVDVDEACASHRLRPPWGRAISA